MSKEPKTAAEAVENWRELVSWNKDLDSGVQPHDIQDAACRVLHFVGKGNLNLNDLIPDEKERQSLAQDYADAVDVMVEPQG